MPDQSRSVSTDSAVKTKPPDFPLPGSLRSWLIGLLGDVKAVEAIPGKNITINRFRQGAQINAKGDGSGSGGADNLETVTGAVNGVPSTLKVQTDGHGWTAI